MDYTISVTDNPKTIALQRALDAYNASNPALTLEGFMQKLIDGQLSNLVAAYVVTSVTNLEFLNRFTQAERIAIRTAAQTNATVADYLALQAAASGIGLTDQRTIDDVNALETAGLIAAGRAAQILAL
jgi:hypothetical protein